MLHYRTCVVSPRAAHLRPLRIRGSACFSAFFLLLGTPEFPRAAAAAACRGGLDTVSRTAWPPAEGRKEETHTLCYLRAERSSPCVDNSSLLDRGGGEGRGGGKPPPDDHSWSKFQCSVASSPSARSPAIIRALTFCATAGVGSGWALRRPLARSAVTFSNIEKGRPTQPTPPAAGR